MVKKALFALFGLIAALILNVAAKTLFTTSKQLNIAPEKPVTVDSAAASVRLAALVVRLPLPRGEGGGEGLRIRKFACFVATLSLTLSPGEREQNESFSALSSSLVNRF